MALTDMPTIKPSKEALFLAAGLLAFFLFFFTDYKESDTELMKFWLGFIKSYFWCFFKPLITHFLLIALAQFHIGKNSFEPIFQRMGFLHFRNKEWRIFY